MGLVTGDKKELNAEAIGQILIDKHIFPKTFFSTLK